VLGCFAWTGPCRASYLDSSAPQGRVDLLVHKGTWSDLLKRTEGLKHFYSNLNEYIKDWQTGTLDHPPDQTVLVGCLSKHDQTVTAPV